VSDYAHGVYVRWEILFIWVLDQAKVRRTMMNDSQEQIQEALLDARDGSDGFKEVHGDGVGKMYKRKEPFKPSFPAAYRAWAEVAMVAPLARGIGQEIAEFMDVMRSGLGSVMCQVQKAQQEGRQYYGVHLEELQENLYGVDLKMQGYPSLLTAYVESQSRLQEALHGALPEANLCIRVGREQLNALRPLYFRHFAWVGKQMVFELALRSLTEARILAGHLCDVETSYQDRIAGQQAESLSEGVDEIKAIHELLGQVDSARRDIDTRREELERMRQELKEREGERAAKEAEIGEILGRLGESLKGLRTHLVDTAQLLDDFLKDVLGDAVEKRMKSGSELLERMREGFQKYAWQGNALVDVVKEVVDKKIQVMAELSSREVKENVLAFERTLSEKEATYADLLERLEKMCQFPGQARWIEGAGA